MTRCEVFLKFFDDLMNEVNAVMPEEVEEFYSMLKTSQESFTDRPAFTENGLAILKYLQSCECKTMKARDIAEGMLLPARKVSGAMRKLHTDGYVEKFGQNPVIYALTEKGKNIDLNNLKENETNA